MSFHRELYEREVTLVDVDGNPSALTVTGTVTVGAAVNQGTGGSSAWKTDGSAVTQPVSVASGADVCEGTAADAAVQGDTAGTISAKLRGLNKSIAAGVPVTVANGADATLGAVADAAVQDDNAGTISAKLRGLNKTLAAGVLVSGVLDPLPATQNTTLAPSVFGAGGGSITVEGYNTLVLHVAGTFVGTVAVTGEFGPTPADHVTPKLYDLLTGLAVASITTTGDYVLDCTGFTTVTLAGSPWTSGTATVTMEGAVGQRQQVPNGANIALGATTDTAATTDTGTFSVLALLKRQLSRLTTLMGQLPAALVSGRFDVNLGAAPGLLLNSDLSIPVGGFTSRNVATLTTKTTVFAAAQDMGGLITLTNVLRLANGSGVIESVILSDKSKQSSAIDVVFFESNPGATTFTDGTALAVNAADVVKIIGCVSIAATDYVAFSANSVATKGALGIPLVVSGGSRNLYAALVCRGTPTYAGANDLQLTVGVAQD